MTDDGEIRKRNPLGKIETGTLITLVIAIVTAAVYIARLDGQVDNLDPSSIQDAEARGMRAIENAKSQALNELKSAELRAIDSFGRSMQVVSLPPGTVLPYVGTQDISYPGWVVCGESGTPDLNGRFLVGTAEFKEAGALVGSGTHVHGVRIKTGLEADGSERPEEGADNYTGDPNWNHKHEVYGSTQSGEHIPPAMKVLFLCKSG